MKIPSKLKVGGHIYKIIKNYKFTQDPKLIGQADHDLGEIRLSPYEATGNHRMPSRIEECFMHEILHCINNVYNENKLVEEELGRLSQGLYQVLKDNKLLKENHA